MKETFHRIVICKCGRGAKLYRGGGGIKPHPGGPTVPVDEQFDPAKFSRWVSAVCRNPECNNWNDPKFLSEAGFRSLTPPNCPRCETPMKPGRDHQGKGDYLYTCENNSSHEPVYLADLLPEWKQTL